MMMVSDQNIPAYYAGLASIKWWDGWGLIQMAITDLICSFCKNSKYQIMELTRFDGNYSTGLHKNNTDLDDNDGFWLKYTCIFCRYKSALNNAHEFLFDCKCTTDFHKWLLTLLVMVSGQIINLTKYLQMSSDVANHGRRSWGDGEGGHVRPPNIWNKSQPLVLTIGSIASTLVWVCLHTCFYMEPKFCHQIERAWC